MRLSTLIIVVLPAVTLACCNPPARSAQPAKPDPKPPAATPDAKKNAADVYKMCWPKLTREMAQAAGEVRLDASGASLATAGGSWEKVAAMLRAQQPLIKDLMKAAAMKRCDFGLKPEPSTAAVDLSGHLRNAGRLLRADAVRIWTTGDLDAAVDRLAAIFEMSAQFSREPSDLVAMSNVPMIMIASETARTMAAGAAGHKLTDAHRRRLLDAIERLDRADPAGLLRAEKAQKTKPDPKYTEATQKSQSKLLDDLARTRDALKKP